MKTEQRTATVEVENVHAEGKTLSGFACLYGAESRDLGGFTETIERGAFSDALAGDPDVILTFNHSPDKVLARTGAGTLTLRDEERGLAFEAQLGEGPTAQDVRDMVRRGDLSGASFRFVVAPDGERWEGERRTLTKVAELIDVSLATTPAYDGPRVELRTHNTAQEAEKDTTMQTEDRNTGLQVEDRAAATEPRPQGLAAAFRAGGFPEETATVEFGEFRAATFSGSVNDMAHVHTTGVELGSDMRYAWPVFPQVPVDAGDTAVQVLRQSNRTLPAAADVVRTIDAVTAKPEVDSELAVVTTALKQVAAIETNIPNVYLEQPAFNSVIETDLRLALNEGLDKLVLDAVAASGFQAPGTDPLLVSIRKAMSTILASGYNPDTLVLTPANAEAIDTLRATTTASEQYYVFAPGELAPRNLFGLQVRVSKTAAAPFVADSSALGRLYVSPITLARFEVDAGSTNRSNVRLEGHAVFGTERQAAAIRIAAS